jgi:hypothetical protein
MELNSSCMLAYLHSKIFECCILFDVNPMSAIGTSKSEKHGVCRTSDVVVFVEIGDGGDVSLKL